MKKITALIFGAALLLLTTGCEKKEEPKEVKTYKYTTAEVYDQMCAKCHGKNAEGVLEKKGPALNDKSFQELRMGIMDIKMGGTGGHSAGTEHEVMEHNMKAIREKGMDYDTDAMAEYIEKNFYKTSVKEAPVAETPVVETPEKAPAPEAQEEDEEEATAAETPEEEASEDEESEDEDLKEEAAETPAAE